MDCKTALSKFRDLNTGKVSEAELIEVVKHIEKCPQCAAALKKVAPPEEATAKEAPVARPAAMPAECKKGVIEPDGLEKVPAQLDMMIQSVKSSLDKQQGDFNRQKRGIMFSVAVIIIAILGWAFYDVWTFNPPKQNASEYVKTVESKFRSKDFDAVLKLADEFDRTYTQAGDEENMKIALLRVKVWIAKNNTDEARKILYAAKSKWNKLSAYVRAELNFHEAEIAFLQNDYEEAEIKFNEFLKKHAGQLGIKQYTDMAGKRLAYIKKKNKTTKEERE